MVPVPLNYRYRASSLSRLLYVALSFVSNYALHFLRARQGSHGYVSTYHPAFDDDPFLEGYNAGQGSQHHTPLVRRASELDGAQPWKRILFPLLIPILVLLSGLFAGLTLGYMSLDETQLNVLSISGTPKQREYANKIKPIRKNGHLLLVTLLLANMIVNETLPVIADGVLGGGFQGVVVSTALIVIFSEIIPQSLFTRHGLYLGAKMAGFTRVLIYGMGIISWPVAKLLEFVLGKHHGLIYRRAELKELIAMHGSHEAHGGDLKTDTVTIIGATLDLQEKVVRQAMTPINDVFMLSIDSKLDYDLLKKICQTGHSRVPVYEEVEVPIAAVPLGSGIASSVGGHDVSMSSASATETGNGGNGAGKQQRMIKVKKIIGILLVKHCVLLDPKDATPLRKIPLNKVPFVPNNEPLLGILDKFQEGRSHMAIVSRFSVEKAQSVKKAVKRGLTQRLRARVGMGDTDSSSSSSSSDEETDSGTSGSTSAKKQTRRKRQGGRKRIISGFRKGHDIEEGTTNLGANNEDADGDGDGETLKEDRTPESKSPSPPSYGTSIDTTPENIEMKAQDRSVAPHIGRKKSSGEGKDVTGTAKSKDTVKKTTFQLSSLSKQAGAAMTGSLLEQSMPADAVLAKEGADEFLQSIDPAVMPLGIITLEDVLEELIGEEIYDEFDPQGAHGDPYAYDVAPGIGTNGPAPGPTYPSSQGHALSQGPEIKIDYLDEKADNEAREGHRPLTAPGVRTTFSSAAPNAGSSAARGIPIPIPPIPMLKGFGFLTRRSRSAPPVPRNKQKRQDQDAAAVPWNDTPLTTKEQEGVDTDDGTKTGGQEDTKPVDRNDTDDKEKPSTDVHPPVLNRAISANPDPTAPSHEIRMPKPILGISGATIQQLGIAGLPGTSGGTRSLSNSRCASPAPSLEAILLERKRRLGREGVAGAGGVGGAGLSGTHGEGGRGKGFKSSPLGPGAGASVGAGASPAGGGETSEIVAERIRENLERERKMKEEKGEDKEAKGGTKEGSGEAP